MPLINDELDVDHGALVVVLVGVSEQRRLRLARVQLPEPATRPVTAQLDTGSFFTAFAPKVFERLQLQPFHTVRIRTPSTRPGAPVTCDVLDVSVTLESGTTTYRFPSVHAIASPDFSDEERVQALLGRDVLLRCAFQYFGPDSKFALSF